MTSFLSSTKPFLEVNDQFPFSQMMFKNPTNVLGESNHYLIPSYLKNSTNTPIFVQTPPCSLKDGTFIHRKKQTVVDLLFSPQNEFLKWLEKVEQHCKQELVTNQTEWFQSEFSKDDIDSLFLPSYKSCKGTNMSSVRASLPITKKIQIYNDKKEELEFSESFSTDEKVIAIVEFVGIKCSPRHFNIEFEIKQMMIKRQPFVSFLYYFNTQFSI